jgi:uncharacterized protein
MRKYIHRAIEPEIISAAKEFPVVVVTGPRQTGKSTLLQKIFPKYRYTTLDDPLTRKTAKEDPLLFLSSEENIIIDEIQHLPELLPYIKMAVDKDRSSNGKFLLTGSQYFPIMSGVSETLAGRVAIYELLGFSDEEIRRARETSSHEDIFKRIFNGSFPEVVTGSASRERFYPSYLQTYIERDIRQITSVHDLEVFRGFIEVTASRAGALLNINEISKECGVSFSSAKRWLSLLESTRMIYLLRPYTRNLNKRVIKSPKLYFTDTGLLSYILRYQDAETLRVGPQGGAFFENFLVSEALKYKFNHNLNFELYFYRDSNHKEIDLLVDLGRSKKLFEIKSTRTPRAGHIDNLKKQMTKFKGSHGYIVSLSDRTDKVTEDITLLPWKDVTGELVEVKELRG